MRWNVRNDQRVIALVSQFKHVTDSMNLGDQGRFTRWNTKTGAQSPRAERLFESLHKRVNAFSGARGDRDAPRKALHVRLGQFAIWQIIDLVENNQGLLAESVEFFDDSVDRFHLLIHAWMTKIDNVNEQIGFTDFLECCLERFDQCVGKFS